MFLKPTYTAMYDGDAAIKQKVILL